MEAPPDLLSDFDMAGPPHHTDRIMDPAPTGLDGKYASFALEGGVGGRCEIEKIFFQKKKKLNFRRRRKTRLGKTIDFHWF